MPRAQNIKPPTKERKGGFIKNTEKADYREKSLKASKKHKEVNERIIYLEKDTHTGITTSRIVYPKKH